MTADSRQSADAIVVDGAYGPFEGSARDRVVLDEYRRLGRWAPDLVELIVERLFAGDGGTFIDVGANIGLVSIPVLEGTRARAVAFEPEPDNFGFLTRNVARHSLTERFECHRTACHAQQGTLALSLSPDNLGDHRLQRTAAGDDRTTIEVATCRLDDALRDHTLAGPIVIKVDAQGSEVSIFEGAADTLARADYLVSEFWPRGIIAHGDSTARFWEIARTFAFGAILHVLPLPEPLHTSQYVFDQLGWIKQDGSDPGFFDLLLSRKRELPRRTR